MAVAHIVSGTFTDTGQSATLTINGGFSLSLIFASTGSVTLERQLPGQTTWQDVATYTASIEDEGVQADKMGTAAKYRLDCTDATGDITYWLG